MTFVLRGLNQTEALVRNPTALELPSARRRLRNAHRVPHEGHKAPNDESRAPIVDYSVYAVRLAGTALVAGLVVVSVPPAAGQVTALPTLRIDAPASLDGVARRLERFPLTGLSPAMRLAGLTYPGPPIDVLLIAERSDLARTTPKWVSGFADASRHLVVLFPERARGYPASSLENVLQHEVAHVLFSRAAGGRPVPRWFNEGLALAAERPVGLAERSRLAWAQVRHGRLSLAELEQFFTEGQAASRRAYAVSSALVRDVLDRHGADSAGQLLAGLAQDQSFDVAYLTVTGETLPYAVNRFWRQRPVWTWWVAFLSGPTFLWAIITTLALFAIYTHRQRRAAQRRQWEEEERAAAEALLRQRLLDSESTAPRSSYEVH
ncbi:MAG: hypothetical protein VYE68_03345 [Acidobacteriota bacterium]|nr:hypothetical protein [Acidobacteriota bacterium]